MVSGQLLKLASFGVRVMINISIKTMKLSGDREEYFVHIEKNGREMTPYKFGHGYRNRAEYHADLFKHVLLGHPEPDLYDPKYNDPPKEQS
jgi:hypothetical protein